MCHETPAWTHVQPFARRFDGRRAHLALIATYMGQDIQCTIRSAGESFVNTSKFDNKSRNFPYELFTGKFKKYCDDLHSRNMTEETKVMKLGQPSK